MKNNKKGGAFIESGIYKKNEIDFSTLMSSLKNNPKIRKAGAILSFSGLVRETSKKGKPVKSLTIDVYDELANQSIHQICEDIKQIPGIIDIKMIHLKGQFEISEDLVYVVIAAAHRKEGFKALRTAVDRYKKEIEVWKREEFLDDSAEWIH
jgi:molybdopterin synthase catalytic subunit